MRSLPLMRTEYWNLSTNTVRSGPTAHIESLTDIENYLLPAAQVQASSLYAWGVADGLLVSAVPNQPDVTLSPGVALDAAGHLIALAANGFAIIDPTVDPNQVQNIPTIRVEPTGLVLSTAGLSGECFLTLTWREVLDPSQPANAPILLHAPWVRLLDVAAFQDLGDQVIVARVSLDPTGLVTALSIDGRRLVGLPASRLELRRPRAAAAPTLSVDHLAAAELGVRADGGLALTLLPPTGVPRPALTVDGAAGTLGLVPQGGRVGIGTPSPGATLVVHDAAAAELRVDGNAGAVGLTLGADATEAWLGSRTNHDLRLVTNGTERLRVLADGKVGLGTAEPTEQLEVVGTVKATAFEGDGAGLTRVRGTDRTKVAKAGDTMTGPLAITAAGTALSVTSNAAVEGSLMVGGKVGIGTTSPGKALDVVGQGLFRSAPWAGAVPGVAGTAIGFDPGNAGGTGFLWSHTTSGAATRLWLDGNPIIFAPAGTERMRMDSSGNVGIGTPNPAELLEVNGRIKAGALTIGPWPANPGYMIFGTNALNQADPGNYALAQGASQGRGATFLNSPVSIQFRIKNADKMILHNNGTLGVHGPLIVQQAHIIKIGVPSPSGRYGNDGIRGEPNLFLDAADTVFIKSGFQAIGMDVAERFKTLEQVHAGQVVIFDEPAEAVGLCDRAYDSRVIGIASGEPAFILGIDPEQMPIALCGRVPCQVDADIAPIAVGDLLTTSPTRGHAQKVTEPQKAVGAIIGKALGARQAGKGTIPVLVMLQ